MTKVSCIIYKQTNSLWPIVAGLNDQLKKKADKWMSLCCTVGYKWVNVCWIVLNLNSMIKYYCIRKKILSGDGLSVWIF